MSPQCRLFKIFNFYIVLWLLKVLPALKLKIFCVVPTKFIHLSHTILAILSKYWSNSSINWLVLVKDTIVFSVRWALATHLHLQQRLRMGRFTTSPLPPGPVMACYMEVFNFYMNLYPKELTVEFIILFIHFSLVKTCQ
jgi:hypothetical protein